MQGTEVPGRLRTEFADLAERPVGLVAELDLHDAVLAPTVKAAPPGRAVLLAQLLAEAPDVYRDVIVAGRPFLLTAEGEWRRVDFADYGIDPTVASELPAALSHDGRRLALADREPGRMIVIDLATGEATSHRLGVRVAAGLRWSPEGGRIFWFNRLGNKESYVFDVRTGESKEQSHPWTTPAYLGSDDRIVEVVSAPEGEGHALRIHKEEGSVDRLLEYPDLKLTWYPVVADKLVAWHHRAKRYRRGPAALVAVDPSDGSLVGALTNPRARTYWARPLAWVSPKHLVFTNFPGSDLYLWSVRDRRVFRVGGFPTGYVAVDVSPPLLRRVLNQAGALAG